MLKTQFLVWLIICLPITLPGQETKDQNLIKNGSLEEVEGDLPKDWVFPEVDPGFKFQLDDAESRSGEKSALIDTTNGTGKASFALFNQYFSADRLTDPVELRGKRIRFRAAVKTSDRDSDGRAQLWLRVDRKNKQMGAFDNMGDRPIRSDDWEHYEIVVDVDDDAERMTIGMLVLGKAKAWIDDVSLEVIDKDDDTTKTTGGALSNLGTRLKQAAASPPQPFFNKWLWLALFVLLLFMISQLKNSILQRFALHFTLVYWILYSSPVVLVTIFQRILGFLQQRLDIENELATKWMGKVSTLHTDYKRQAIDWVNERILNLDPITYALSGSGDKTEDFVYLLVCVGLSLIVATAWSLILIWRRTDQVWIRDILRSYMRYVLAFTMLGYGLAKTGFIQTQFATGGEPYEGQLMRTYGESSPMGLLWTFMAASSSYTFFAGLGEVVGGVVLVFRRTATLGGLVTFGVMLNVVMLNFCYDVPVKQYSFHLMIMALLVAGPDMGRLFNVLLWNRATQPNKHLTPPYTNKFTIWTHCLVKAIVVFCAVAIPIYDQAKKEIQHEHAAKAESKHLLINRGFRWVQEVPFNK